MPKLVDRVPENRFIGLFVSRSGAGKSVAAASFPKPVDFDDFDGRIGGVQVSWLDQNGITYDYWPPKSPGMITRLNEKMENILAASRLASSQTVISLPKTYVCDSLTNQALAFLSQALPLTHGDIKNKRDRWLGNTPMPGKQDFGLEAQAVYEYMLFLKSVPIQNVIVTAHYVDQYGKARNEKGEVIDEYSENVITGKKLSVRDKIGENIQTHFDHIFEFERQTDRFFVYFRGELARTSYDWLPTGRHEWTRRNFYEFMMSFKNKAEGAAK